MRTERRQPLANRISWAATICLALGGLFVTSCDRPTASDSTASHDAPVAEVVLSADPNPVAAGNPDGKTIVTWDTGSSTAGDVYVGTVGNEKLFASGSKGSQEASWIKPGSTEFRLYNQADHKLLAQLTVTMRSSPEALVSSASTTPASSASP